MLNIKTANGYIIALFLFQYSILIPIMHYSNSSICVGISTAALVVLLFAININERINSKIPFVTLLLCLFLCINTIVTQSGVKALLSFFAISIPCAILFLHEFDKVAFLRAGFVLSIVNFVLLFWYPFCADYSYMRFGYGMLLTALFSYAAIRFSIEKGETHKKVFYVIHFVLLVISAAEMLLYGSRGAFLSLFIFGLFDIFFIGKGRAMKVLLLFGGGLTIINLSTLLDLFIKITEKVDIDLYVLYKMRQLIIEGSVGALSGRYAIWVDALERMKKSPVFGNGLYLSAEGHYDHNLFLQVGADLGVIALFALAIWVIWEVLFIINRRKDMSSRYIHAIFFAIAIGRLLFSSTIWRRPEFWMLFFFSMAGCEKSKNKSEVLDG